MSDSIVVRLDQLLMLTGRLDDTLGFDTPRERFRRFLKDCVVDVANVRALVSECQHAPGDQHRRALQDIVATLGRFMGFDVSRGAWRSAALSVLLDVRSADTADEIVDGLTRAVVAFKTDNLLPTGPAAGLAVVTPLSPARRKIEDAIEAAKPPVPVTVIALDTLLALAEMAATGRLTHADVVRLLESGIAVDFVVDVLGRSGGSAVSERTTLAAAHPSLSRETPYFWLASVAPDHGMSAEEFLELVVARRYVFGIGDSVPDAGPVQTGDSLCFHIAGKGVVGRARVISIMEEGGGIRDAQRFRQILRLADVMLNRERPIPLDPETDLRLRAVPPSGRRHVQTLLAISHECFVSMTAPLRDANEETAADDAAVG
jgi:hypothetical protein